MRRLGSNSEERSRLTAALSCLKSADETGKCNGLKSVEIEINQSSSSPVLSTSTMYINIYSRKLFQKLFSVYVSVCVPKCYKYNPITFNGQSFVNKHHKCFIIKSVEIKVIFQSQRWGFDSSSVPLCSTARHEWEMLSGKAVLGHMCRVVTSWKGCS